MSNTFLFLCVLGFILYSAGFGKNIGGEFHYFNLSYVHTMRYAHSAVLLLRVLLLFLLNRGEAGYRHQLNAQLLYCIENGKKMVSCRIHKITPWLPSAKSGRLKKVVPPKDFSIFPIYHILLYSVYVPPQSPSREVDSWRQPRIKPLSNILLQ